MATKRSDKNQLNIRLDDESMAILDAQVAYEIEQLKMLLGDKYDMVVGKTATLSRTIVCLLYTSPSPRDRQKSRMPSSA